MTRIVTGSVYDVQDIKRAHQKHGIKMWSILAGIK